MPVVINEIVIKTNVQSEKSETVKNTSKNDGQNQMEEIVKQAVERVFEILAEKKER